MYAIIGNCNFSSRTDPLGRAVHAAWRAVQTQGCRDESVIAALDELEDVLAEHADSQYVIGREACRRAEEAVAAAWRKHEG